MANVVDADPYPILTPGEIQDRGLPMVSAEDIIRLQQQKNDVQQAQWKADELENLTLRRFWSDIGGALDGCMHDLLVTRAPLAQAFASPPRLRGFGFLLLAIGLFGLLSCLVLGLRV